MRITYYISALTLRTMATNDTHSFGTRGQVIVPRDSLPCLIVFVLVVTWYHSFIWTLTCPPPVSSLCLLLLPTGPCRRWEPAVCSQNHTLTRFWWHIPIETHYFWHKWQSSILWMRRKTHKEPWEGLNFLVAWIMQAKILDEGVSGTFDTPSCH